MYLSSILLYLTWPALIAISYGVIIFALKVYEKRSRTGNPEEQLK